MSKESKRSTIAEVEKIRTGLESESYNDSMQQKALDDVIAAGSVPLLVRHMEDSQSPKLQLEAARVLLNIVKLGRPDHTQVVLDSGAVPALVDLLSASPPPTSDDYDYGKNYRSLVLMGACRLLGTLAGTSAANRDRILAAGALEPTLALLRGAAPGDNDREKSHMLRYAAWAIAHFLRAGEQQPPPAAEHVALAVPVLVETISKFDAGYEHLKMLGFACWGLVFAACQGQAHRSAMVSAGACARLRKFLDSYDGRLVTPCLKAVGAFLQRGGSDDAAALQAFWECGALPALGALLRPSKPPTIREEAGLAIATLITLSPSPERVQAVLTACSSSKDLSLARDILPHLAPEARACFPAEEPENLPEVPAKRKVQDSERDGDHDDDEDDDDDDCDSGEQDDFEDMEPEQDYDGFKREGRGGSGGRGGPQVPEADGLYYAEVGSSAVAAAGPPTPQHSRVILRADPEVLVAQIKASITAKDSWQAKIRIDKLVATWRKEATKQGAPLDAFDAAIRDLKADQFYEKSGLAYHDHLLPADLTARLARRLGALADRCEDFHPGTGRIVKDLIHPSLYPYVHGESWPPQEHPESRMKMRKEVEAGSSDAPRGEVSASDPFGHCLVGVEEWSRYQWLPSEVDVDAEGKCRLASYVNNAPKDDELSGALEEALSRLLPIFEEVITAPGRRQLVRLRQRRLQVIIKAANYELQPGQAHQGGWHVEGMLHERIVAAGLVYYGSSDGIVDEGLAFRRLLTRNFVGYGYHMPPFDYRGNESPDGWNETNPPQVKDVEFFSASQSEKTEAVKDDEESKKKKRKRRPREEQKVPTGFVKPRFSLSGQDSKVQGLAKIGSTDRFPNHVDLGVVGTPSGRCLVFKNALQHRVEMLYNKSETEPGVRRILVFWLVDPDVRIPSTADVPPQQWESMRPLLARTLHEQWHSGGDPQRQRLRVSTVKLILDYAKWGFTFEEAAAHRLALMRERTFSTKQVSNEFEKEHKREYTFCEH